MTPKSLIAPARLARRPVLSTQADGRLVDLVRAGYEPAFEAIVARYRGALMRYVERFLPRERAEDAVQQSFVNAYEAMLRDESRLNLRPWLYRIAHNTALNTLRDQALRHSQLPDAIDGVERPDEALERAQGLRELLAAVQALPERQRDAIVLRELEGRSYEEIAAELGVSGGSVRQLLNRARKTLRAGATALTPAGLVTRLPWAASGEPVAARVAELCGAAGGGALAAKVCATALLTGAVAGGVAVAPERGGDRPGGPEKAAASEGGGGDGSGAGGGARGTGGGGEGDTRDDGDRSARADGQTERRRDRDDDRRGPGDEDEDDRDGRRDEDGDDRSGPGGEDDDDDDDPSDDDSGHGGSGRSGGERSGSGGGSGQSGGDRSGPGGGSGESGSGGEGSGSGSSGGSGGGSGSNSGPGSGSGNQVAPDGGLAESDLSGSGESDSGSGSSGSTADPDELPTETDD